jgi:hypothetical protein
MEKRNKSREHFNKKAPQQSSLDSFLVTKDILKKPIQTHNKQFH